MRALARSNALLLLKSAAVATAASFTFAASANPGIGFENTPSYFGPKDAVLTFDDGPAWSTDTLDVLDVLKAHGVKGSFFVNTGPQSTHFETTIRRIVDEGHELAGHTRNHPHLPELSGSELRDEILGTTTDLNALGNMPRVTLFRAPFGEPYQWHFQKNVLQWALTPDQETKLGTYSTINGIVNEEMIHVGWNIDSQDWQCSQADMSAAGECMADNVIASLQQGHYGIILLHSVHPRTALGLPKLITYLKDNGYNFKFVEDGVCAKFGATSANIIDGVSGCDSTTPGGSTGGTGSGGASSGGSGSGGASSGGSGSGTGGASTGGTGGSTAACMISDVEGDDGARWYVSNDRTAGTQEMTVAQPGGASGTGSAAVGQGSGFTEWGASIGRELNEEGACSLAGTTGIEFMAKGPGTVRVSIRMPGVLPTADGGTCTADCWDAHGVDVTLTDGWGKYSLAWSDFQQAGWGAPVDFDATAAISIDFTAPPNAAFDFAIDDLQATSTAGGGTVGGTGGGSTGQGGAPGQGGVIGSGGAGGMGAVPGTTGGTTTGAGAGPASGAAASPAMGAAATPGTTDPGTLAPGGFGTSGDDAGGCSVVQGGSRGAPWSALGLLAAAGMALLRRRRAS